MNKAKRFRKHWHNVYTWRYNGHLYFSTSDAACMPYAVKVWYNYCSK